MLKVVMAGSWCQEQAASLVFLGGCSNVKAAQVQCVLWCGGCCGAVVLRCGSVVAITAVAGAL